VNAVNAPQITVSGNVAAAPTLRLAGGAPVTSFRIGATPRRYDKSTDTWTDAETLWFTVTAWRALAEHCASSLNKGDKVLVSGKLSQSSWTGDDGAVRTGLEVDAASVGLDLSRNSAVSVRRPSGSRGADEAAETAPPEAGPDDNAGEWLSTGEVDKETGEVRLVRAVPEQDASEREPAGV
jgi:single-strand DNA-binding protein